MVFAHVRRIGRLFSIVLLLWTAVDLVEHFSPGLGPRMTGRQGSSVGPSSSAAPAQQAAHTDHSFCCSHSVDVQTPFAVARTSRVVGLAADHTSALPFRNPTGLYHPPLA